MKICGITTPEAADAALRAGADFGGLVFHAGSPRHLSSMQARALAQRTCAARVDRGAGRPTPTTTQMAGRIARRAPDFFQLHGNESARARGPISRPIRLPVIKAVGVAEAADVASAQRL